MTRIRRGPPARSKLSARVIAPLVGVGVLAAALAGPAGAHAATFATVPPKTNPSGSGPFMFSFTPSSGNAVRSASSVYSFYGGDAPIAPPTAVPVVSPPVPQPPAAHVHFRPANVPWPLSIARARKAARAKAIRAWGARKPKVLRAHRVSIGKVRCRVSWPGKTGTKRTRTVTVKRTSTFGVQAYAA